jgi:hypothetical protein
MKLSVPKVLGIVVLSAVARVVAMNFFGGCE